MHKVSCAVDRVNYPHGLIGEVNFTYSRLFAYEATKKTTFFINFLRQNEQIWVLSLWLGLDNFNPWENCDLLNYLGFKYHDNLRFFISFEINDIYA